MCSSDLNIAAGQSDVVGVAIGNAGSLTGTIVLGLTSKAAAAGLTDLALASKSVAVTGAAYDLAKADLSTTTLTLGNVRVADVATVDVTNTVITNALYQDKLDVAASGTNANLTVSSPARVAAGSTGQIGVTAAKAIGRAHA